MFGHARSVTFAGRVLFWAEVGKGIPLGRFSSACRKCTPRLGFSSPRSRLTCGKKGVHRLVFSEEQAAFGNRSRKKQGTQWWGSSPSPPSPLPTFLHHSSSPLLFLLSLSDLTKSVLFHVALVQAIPSCRSEKLVIQGCFLLGQKIGQRDPRWVAFPM